jgi:hypothetical protein
MTRITRIELQLQPQKTLGVVGGEERCAVMGIATREEPTRAIR